MSGGGRAGLVYGASPIKRRRRTRAQLARVDEAIIAAVDADRPVMLRGVYYRVVSAGAVPKTEAGYQLVGRELLKLRRARVVAYGDITDGTRFLHAPKTWNSVEDALRNTAAVYRRQLWDGQQDAVLMFTEKDAISGVLLPVTESWDVPLGVMRGYSSESFAWQVSELVRGIPRRVYVYQFGDHDPSGRDAWRAFAERVCAFVEEAAGAGRCLATELVFERLAVTEEQIAEWGLPTRPTKRTDSRAARFAGESVEVDAIPARDLRELAEAEITRHIDAEQWRIAEEAEASEREILTRIAARQNGGNDE
jgi:hypothetical protein